MCRPSLKGDSGMIRYIVKRLLLGILVLFGVTVITFSITHLLPSDPARSWAGAKATEEQVAAARIELGLDKPIHVQFAKYISDLLHGDLGVSYTSRRPITAEMAEAVPATLELVFYAIFFGIILGVIMGVFAAKYKNGILDHLVRIFAIGSASIPSFVFAMVLQLIFFQKLGWLPLGGRLSTTATILYNVPNITGWLTIDSLLVGNFALFQDALLHLILPAIPIAVYPAGTVARMTRSSLVEVLNEDYIMAARSYGISESKVLWKSALKNTIGTTATVAALSIGYTLVGTFLVESIFGWPGIGKFMSDSVTSLDYPAIMGATLFSTVAYLILNLIADIIVALDPRVRV